MCPEMWNVAVRYTFLHITDGDDHKLHTVRKCKSEPCMLQRFDFKRFGLGVRTGNYFRIKTENVVVEFEIRLWNEKVGVGIVLC